MQKSTCKNPRFFTWTRVFGFQDCCSLPFYIVKILNETGCCEVLGYLEVLRAISQYTRTTMSPSCPISQRRIDTNLVRVISFQVFLFTVLFAITGYEFFIFFVLFDFIARVFRQETLSPFAQIAKRILEQWNVKPHYSDESPKRFALYLGLGVTLVIVLFTLMGYEKTAVGVALILMICSFLEVLFDFCIGCKLYYVLQLVKGMSA